MMMDAHDEAAVLKQPKPKSPNKSLIQFHFTQYLVKRI